jgi:hypothetical protein
MKIFLISHPLFPSSRGGPSDYRDYGSRPNKPAQGSDGNSVHVSELQEANDNAELGNKTDPVACGVWQRRGLTPD